MTSAPRAVRYSSLRRNSSAPMPRAALTFAALAVSALCARGSDWPQFLGPTRNGVAADSDVRADWPAGGPAKLWERPVGRGWSGPVVVDGKLILFHRVENEER